jgi:hypothetical protein
MAANAKRELMEIEDGGIASFLTSNLDEIDDSILAFGMPGGINSMRDVAEKMAKMGRNGDNVIIHSHTDEMLIPKEVGDKYPELIAQAKEAIAAEGGDPEAYIVGSETNSINPLTGQPEFFLKKIVSGVKNFLKGVVNVVKKIAPVVLPIALNVIFPGMGAVASGAIGAGLGGLIQGKSVKDSLKMALMGGVTGGFMKGVSNAFAGNDLMSGVFSGKEGYDFFQMRDFKADPLSFLGKGAAKTPDGTPKVDAGEGSWWNKAAEKTGELGGKAKDYLFPDTGALQAQNYQKALEAATEAGVPLTDTLKATLYEKAAPGMFRTYGPLAATGLTVAAAAGAFDTPKVALPPGTEFFEPVTQEEIDAVRVGVPGRPPETPASSLVVPPSNIPGVNPPQNQMTYAQFLAPQAVMPNIEFPQVQFPQVQPPQPSQQIFGYDRFGNPIQSIYGTAAGNVIRAANGGGIDSFPRRTGAIRGPGTETSDSVPAMLSDGEFVMNARAVRGAGNGNREAGMRRMYDMMKMFEGGAVAR